jgi:hypothetical protein
MTATVNGQQLYQWSVSNRGAGCDTPNSSFKPFRKEIDDYSEEWEMFFTQGGPESTVLISNAIPAHVVSQGCVPGEV